MIVPLGMAMEHVVACEAKEILHALLALYDLPDRAAQLALEAHVGRVRLHDVLHALRRRRTVVAKVYDLIVRLVVDSSRGRKTRWRRTDSVALVRLNKFGVCESIGLAARIMDSPPTAASNDLGSTYYST
jgi:hypothetical protein